MRAPALIVALAFAAACQRAPPATGATALSGATASTGPTAPTGPRAAVRDLDGAPADPIADARGRLLVLLFLSTTCPISNRYAPEIERLATAFGARGVRFAAVYPDADDDAATIRTHRAEHQLSLPAYRDPGHVLVDVARATVTPEAVILGPDGALAYRGRIDDLYPALGRMRPLATTHDLAAALDRALAGDLRTTTTTAVGCAIGHPG